MTLQSFVKDYMDTYAEKQMEVEKTKMLFKTATLKQKMIVVLALAVVGAVIIGIAYLIFWGIKTLMGW